MKCPCFSCARRRRQGVKALILALVAIFVCVLPVIGLEAFLYVFGALAAIVGLVALGMLFELWLGFRAFEAWTGEQARRIFGRREKPVARLVRR